MRKQLLTGLQVEMSSVGSATEVELATASEPGAWSMEHVMEHVVGRGEGGIYPLK